MYGIVEFYQSNHLSVLIAVVILFGIYISSIKNRNRNIVTMNSENEDNGIPITIGTKSNSKDELKRVFKS